MSVFIRLLLVLILLLIIAWTIWPLVGVSVAGAIAERNGCDLDEGSVHPCIVNGRDIGGALYGWAVMGWFMIVTIPTGLLALAVYGAILLAVWIVRRARRRNAATGTSAGIAGTS